MTEKEWIAKFDADFAKMQHNRSKVSLEVLKRDYERPYNTLVAEIECDADWWADSLIRSLAFPINKADRAGNDWLRKRCDAIIEQEKRPGGLRDQWRAALIDRLDRDEYERLVFKVYERLLHEAFDPYWQRHCRWAGPPGNRWIYNDIFRKWWWPPHDDPALGVHVGGMWISSDYTGGDCRFPPNIGSDNEQEATA